MRPQRSWCLQTVLYKKSSGQKLGDMIWKLGSIPKSMSHNGYMFGCYLEGNHEIFIDFYQS